MFIHLRQEDLFCKGRTNMFFHGILDHCTEADDVLLIDGSGHHVNLPRSIDVAEQFLVQFVRSLEPKTH